MCKLSGLMGRGLVRSISPQPCPLWWGTTSTISFMFMWAPDSRLSQSIWNQRDPQKALQPHKPDASDVTIILGVLLVTAFSRYTIPWFHKHAQHSMSKQASRSSHIKWLCSFAEVDRSMSLQRNALPALTTLHVWGNEPMSDSESHFLHTFLPH